MDSYKKFSAFSRLYNTFDMQIVR